MSNGSTQSFQSAGTLAQVATVIGGLSEGDGFGQEGGGWLGDLFKTFTGRKSNSDPLGNPDGQPRENIQDNCRNELSEAKREIAELKKQLEQNKNNHERDQYKEETSVVGEAYREDGEAVREAHLSSNPGNPPPYERENKEYEGGGKHTQIKTFKELLASALRDLESLTKKMNSIRDMVNK